jgi:hypothetical protein
MRAGVESGTDDVGRRDAVLFAGAGRAQNSSSADRWQDWRFLLGDWESTGGSGEPGKVGSGAFDVPGTDGTPQEVKFPGQAMW